MNSREYLNNIEETISKLVSKKIAPDYFKLLNGVNQDYFKLLLDGEENQDYYRGREVFDRVYLGRLDKDKIIKIEKRTFEFYKNMYNLGCKDIYKLETALRKGKIPEKKIISTLINEKENTINIIRLDSTIIQAMILGYINKTKNKIFRGLLKKELYEMLYNYFMIDRDLLHLT